MRRIMTLNRVEEVTISFRVMRAIASSLDPQLTNSADQNAAI
jgi:hypothetical protein